MNNSLVPAMNKETSKHTVSAQDYKYIKYTTLMKCRCKRPEQRIIIVNKGNAGIFYRVYCNWCGKMTQLCNAPEKAAEEWERMHGKKYKVKIS